MVLRLGPVGVYYYLKIQNFICSVTGRNMMLFLVEGSYCTHLQSRGKVFQKYFERRWNRIDLSCKTLWWHLWLPCPHVFITVLPEFVVITGFCVFAELVSIMAGELAALVARLETAVERLEKAGLQGGGSGRGQSAATQPMEGKSPTPSSLPTVTTSSTGHVAPSKLSSLYHFYTLSVIVLYYFLYYNFRSFNCTRYPLSGNMSFCKRQDRVGYRGCAVGVVVSLGELQCECVSPVGNVGDNRCSANPLGV